MLIIVVVPMVFLSIWHTTWIEARENVHFSWKLQTDQLERTVKMVVLLSTESCMKDKVSYKFWPQSVAELLVITMVPPSLIYYFILDLFLLFFSQPKRNWWIKCWKNRRKGNTVNWKANYSPEERKKNQRIDLCTRPWSFEGEMDVLCSYKSVSSITEMDNMLHGDWTVFSPPPPPPLFPVAIVWLYEAA